LKQGAPILLSFARAEDASAAYDALLKHREQQLDQEKAKNEPASSPSLYSSLTVEATPKRLLPQFGAVAQSPIVAEKATKR
jgi:hypothetical protein